MTEPVIPKEFYCAITHAVMEYPYTTAAGNSYEFSAISAWLKNNSTDPLSNVVLKRKTITQNNALRSQIVTWFETHPKQARYRNQNAVKPPQSEVNFGDSDESGIAKILQYKGKITVKKSGKNKAPQPYSAFGKNYNFQLTREGDTQVRCDSGKWIDAPNKAMFASDKGVVFFDPTEFLETRVLPGTEFGRKVCKFSNGCNKPTCPFPHPFVCSRGVDCTDQATCKFLHPDRNSVVPVGTQYPLFKLEIPEAATCFQFQGEFVFFFVPYSGAWAKDHYQKVIVHRFDSDQNIHKFLGEYSLDKHYCNCVVGGGRHMILSWWPYEEEAMRTIWDCLKAGRAMEKELKKKIKDLEKKDAEIMRLENLLSQKDQEIARLRNVAANAKQSARSAWKAAASAKNLARRKTNEVEAMWRQQRRNQERLNERLRLRDPIHVYTCSGGNCTKKSDWTLILDYHKGAHDMELGNIGKNGVQSLDITENESVFQFDLIVPKNLNSIGTSLPIIPGKLCVDF